jgi:predicted CXXCH cytochrome family protein
MKKRIGFILIATALMSLLFLPAFSQEDMEVVDDIGFLKRQRPPAVFRHDAHNETAQIEECNECHHVYENGKKVEDESSEDRSCSDCHEEHDSGNQPGLRKAFHMNCKGCHLAKKQGPVMCGKCHVR